MLECKGTRLTGACGGGGDERNVRAAGRARPITSPGQDVKYGTCRGTCRHEDVLTRGRAAMRDAPSWGTCSREGRIVMRDVPPTGTCGGGVQVFPRHVSERLKKGEAAVSEAHECVTILFSDIVGYTRLRLRRREREEVVTICPLMRSGHG